MSLSMITDRTAADVMAANVLRLKIQSGLTLTTTETAAFERGTCTATMLNRIENAQKTLAETLRGSGYMVSIENKTNLTATDIFGNADYRRLLENIALLRSAFYTYSSTPDTPGYIYGWKEANDIEKILKDIDDMIADMKSRYRECGTFSCGEENDL